MRCWTNWLCFLQGDKDFTPAAAQVAHQKPQPGVPKHPPIQHIKPQIHQPRKWAGGSRLPRQLLLHQSAFPFPTEHTRRRRSPLQAQIFENSGSCFLSFSFFLFSDLHLRGGNPHPSNVLVNTTNESNQPIATTSDTSQRGAWAFFFFLYPCPPADQKGNSTGHEVDTKPKKGHRKLFTRGNSIATRLITKHIIIFASDK